MWSDKLMVPLCCLGFLAMGLLVLIGVVTGKIWHAETTHATMEEQVLGEVECVRMDWIAPGPYGVIKVFEQQLCGYHLEWGTPLGGIPAEPFIPNPNEHSLDSGG